MTTTGQPDPILQPNPINRDDMDPVLAQGLLAAQRAVRVALRDATNTHHGYRYASSEEVITVGRDALSDAGLAWALVEERIEILPKGSASETGGGVALLYIKAEIVATGNGARLALSTVVPIVPQQGRPLDKAVFGARTEGISYCLRDALLIPRQDSPDVSGRNDGSTRQRGPRPEPRDIQQVLAEIKAATEMPRLAAIVQAQRAIAGGSMSDDEADTLEAAFVARAVEILDGYNVLVQVTKAATLLKRHRPASPERAAQLDEAVSRSRKRVGGVA